ncbi:MAG: selenium-dependent molybdenum cofactor biosynthesis protein YqeB [Eubacteriales bacterium]|nr:selenium-dependent molybdenum cofactor biosynthesis protein YqeB [Eubacteriales bacterium]
MSDRQKRPVIVRGGGDLATGVIATLVRVGFPVLVLEIETPSAIRRRVALCEAVYDGEATVEDIHCRLVRDMAEIEDCWQKGEAAMVIDPSGRWIDQLRPWAVVDAILAKKNLGTTIEMAPKTIALGPGFTAGKDARIVIETMRGHHLGRLIRQGSALPNTGVPGLIGGQGKARVIHAPAAGIFRSLYQIGETVEEGETIGIITDGDSRTEVTASLTGLLRGVIRDGFAVTKGLKIADIDPRAEEYKNCFTISDKADHLGGSVLSALLQMEEEDGF